MRSLLIVFTIAILSCSNVFAQKIDTTKARLLREQAFTLMIDSAKYNEAILLIDEARAIYEQADFMEMQDSFIGETYAARAEGFWLQKNYRQAIDNFKTEQKYIKKYSSINSLTYANSINNLGLCYEIKSDYDEALKHYEQALLAYKNKPKNKNSINNLPVAYNNLAICYAQKGEYQKARIYFEKTYNLEKRNAKTPISELLKTLRNIGYTFQDDGNYINALRLFQQNELSLTKIKKTNPDLVIKNTYNIANCHFHLGKIKEAKKGYTKILSLLKKRKIPPTNIKYADPFRGLSKSLLKQGLYKEAQSNIEKSLKIRKNYFPSLHPKIINDYLLASDIEASQKNYNKALSIIEEPIQLFQNGNPKVSLATIQHLNKYLELLKTKGDLQFELFQTTPDTQQINLALETYLQTFPILDSLKISYTNKSAKEQLLAQNQSIFKNTIALYYHLYEQSNNPTFIEKAFAISEKGKSSILRESILAQSFIGLPDSLIEKERQLKINIAFYEKQRFEKNNPQENITQLFSLKNELEYLLKHFETNFPEYYQLKYKSETISINDLQQLLSQKHKSLLSYFKGDNHLYAFIINPDTIYFKELAIPENFNKKTTDFLTAINDYPTTSETTNIELENTYVQLAFQLYQTLFEPIASLLNPKVIIIPHDHLAYLPFDVLLQNLPEENYQFRSHNYLINDYQFSYCYSATLFHQIQHKTIDSKSNELIAFAPEFNDLPSLANRSTRNKLGKLSMNIPEVEKLKNFYNADIYTHKQATEENFVKNAHLFQIIHLATHGIANDEKGDYGYLAFSPQNDTIENERLYAREIHPLPLNAEMIVLSACETSSGELKMGEGIASLERAFSYAGSKSVISTLWNINDAATASIMENFYANLTNKIPKDEALRLARLDYIKNNRNQVVHPAFWGAFLAIGDMRPVPSKENLSLWLTSIFIGIAIISFFSFKYYQKRIKTSPNN